MTTTFDPLADTDLITEYIDSVIKKELDHVGVFAQFSKNTSLGNQTGSGPADFQYTRAQKDTRGFKIYKTRPGSLTRYGRDAFSATTSEVEIYTGGVELANELTKVQKWNFQQDILDDMAIKAALYYEEALATYLIDNAGTTSELVSGSLTFPGDIIEGKKAILAALKRDADTMIIGSDKYHELIQLPQFIEADKAGPAHTLLNGQIGRVFGLDVVVTPYLNTDGIESGTPSSDTIIFLNRQRPTLRTMYWNPLFKFDMWEVKERHVWTHELRGYFDIYIWDSNAVTKMVI